MAKNLEIQNQRKVIAARCGSRGLAGHQIKTHVGYAMQVGSQLPNEDRL